MIAVMTCYPIILVSAGSGPDLSLDMGEDGIIDWSSNHDSTWPKRTNNLAVIADDIIYKDCSCSGCIKSTLANHCTIPVKFNSKYNGNLTINDLRVLSYHAFVLANVSYADSHRYSKGACWDIQDPEKTEIYKIPENSNCIVTSQSFTSAMHIYPDTNDAIDDAVWRLLNQTLDQDEDWIVDMAINENMSIQTHSILGVQSLWGPSEMRLIVWI